MNMGAIGCPETSVTTNLRCVISHKSGSPISTSAGAWSDTTVSLIKRTVFIYLFIYLFISVNERSIPAVQFVMNLNWSACLIHPEQQPRLSCADTAKQERCFSRTDWLPVVSLENCLCCFAFVVNFHCKKLRWITTRERPYYSGWNRYTHF
jgi:hypothetical protein